MHNDTDFTEFVTFTIAGQIFGLPIARVQDVFKPVHITRVPLAGAEIAGVLNLRGRIVTAIDMRSRLDAQQARGRRRTDGDRHRSEGRIVRPPGRCGRRGAQAADSQREPNPINLDRKLAALSAGVYRLDGQLLVVLDIDHVLDLRSEAAAA